MSAPLTFNLDQNTVARVDAFAAEHAMTRDDVVSNALAEYFVAQSEDIGDLLPWQLEKIEAGLAAAERGDFASDEKVEAVFEKYRDVRETPPVRT